MNPFEEKQEKLKWFLTEPAAPSAAAPVAGRRIGKYRLIEVLGEGGMGVVFRAADDELGREVALKMLKTAQVYSATQIERFQREARSTARLRHPGIATLYEIGREDDSLFLVLELVRGKAFDPRAGELPARVGLLEKVARAVHYAHEQGVVHRDLKPGNILVEADGTPRLLDFGLSRDAEAPELTKTGAFFGTAPYAAPEQADGRVRDIGPRTDVYSLGAILYEILSGHPPARGATVAEILRKVMSEEPATPPGPPDLVTVCLKALEKDPPRRYGSAAEFAEDLARFLRGEPVAAKPLSRSARFARAARRHRAVLLPAVLGALLIAALVFVAAREFGRGPEPVLFDDFEHTPQNWKLALGEEFPGAAGELVVDHETAHSGKGAWRLHVDFSGGGRYVGAWRFLPALHGKDLQTLRFWVKTSTVQRLMMRVEDTTLQCHQKSIVLTPSEDWQEIVLPVADLVGGEHWGGVNDGVWHGPAHAFGIHVSVAMFRAPDGKSGTVWIDDVSGDLIGR